MINQNSKNTQYTNDDSNNVKFVIEPVHNDLMFPII
ncbi:hypothetical protein BB2000_2609 [Proteus mirabilis BB2000]|nr:hypothetical protein BB2000_2609 [Proteus mirabilis BB2000]